MVAHTPALDARALGGHRCGLGAGHAQLELEPAAQCGPMHHRRRTGPLLHATGGLAYFEYGVGHCCWRALHAGYGLGDGIVAAPLTPPQPRHHLVCQRHWRRLRNDLTGRARPWPDRLGGRRSQRAHFDRDLGGALWHAVQRASWLGCEHPASHARVLYVGFVRARCFSCQQRLVDAAAGPRQPLVFRPPVGRHVADAAGPALVHRPQVDDQCRATLDWGELGRAVHAQLCPYRAQMVGFGGLRHPGLDWDVHCLGFGPSLGYGPAPCHAGVGHGTGRYC